MLKRLYKRLLMWAFAPALDPLRVGEQQALNSIRVDCANPKAIVADSGVWALDPKGAFSFGKAP